MRLAVTTPPADAPVTLAEARAWCRVDHADDDALIGALVLAATGLAEAFTGRAFVTRTLTAYLDASEATAPVRLPYGPVASVSSVTATDAEDAATVVPSTAYRLAGDRLVPSEASGAADWPTDLRAYEGLAVEYVAGQALADVPEAVKHGVLIAVADLYENPSAVAVGTVVGALPTTSRAVLAPFVRREL